MTRQKQVLFRWVAGVFALGMAAAQADAQAVPPDLQAAILARTLAYDRALKVKAGPAVVVSVLAKAGDKSSLEAQEHMMRALAVVEPRTVHGLPLKASAGAF